jgi:lipopolysaccharide/colanic/teichoic acid biosynthesis glycosyltransferase
MGFVSYALAEIVPFRARPQHEIWTICLVYLTAVAAFRLVLTAALRPGVVPAGAGCLAFPEVPNPADVSVAQPGRRFQPVGLGPTILAVMALRSRRDAGNMHRDGAAEDTTSCAASPSARRSLPDGRPKKRVGRLVDLDTLSNDWITRTPIGREGWGSRVFRRSFDILGSLALLWAVLPLLLITALAIRLESRGPVFYRQERVGKDGRVFTLFKFRSMTVDAERDGPRWALPRDPRVTRVGRIIRLTRIDEVPQVFNVLRGEMALIGPRPERPAFVEQLAAVIPHYRSRSAVRPGITGWAQVNYPYGASVEDARNKLAFDLYYIQHRTLALDVSIVIGTIRVVIFQEGAR